MQATLTAIEHHSDTVISFHFQPERSLDYIAGQFIELSLPPDISLRGNDRTQRWFTLSSSPTESSLTITVRYGGPRSSFKQALRQLPIGSQVHISDALGDFVLPLDESIPLVWLAAGIGITPFRSMAVWITDNHEARRISLFHRTADKDIALFADIMKQAGAIEPIPAISHLSAAAVIQASPDAAASLFYIAGPDGFVKDLSASLKSAGIPAVQIITDIFLGYT